MLDAGNTKFTKEWLLLPKSLFSKGRQTFNLINATKCSGAVKDVMSGKERGHKGEEQTVEIKYPWVKELDADRRKKDAGRSS